MASGSWWNTPPRLFFLGYTSKKEISITDGASIDGVVASCHAAARKLDNLFRVKRVFECSSIARSQIP